MTTFLLIFPDRKKNEKLVFSLGCLLTFPAFAMSAVFSAFTAMFPSIFSNFLADIAVVGAAVFGVRVLMKSQIWIRGALFVKEVNVRNEKLAFNKMEEKRDRQAAWRNERKYQRQDDLRQAKKDLDTAFYRGADHL